MIKEKIVVPKGIEYLSDWKEFNFYNLLPKKCILDKVIPGCGFTEYCITGKENVILCSPRKVLLENKYDQHEEEVYLVRNEYEVIINYDKNLTNKPDKSALTTIIKNPTPEESKKIYTRVAEEIENYKIKRDNAGLKPYKILVTYDSFHIVKDILEHFGIFKNFVIVVDEFQSILHDSKFKSNTELDFLEYLQQSHSSLFVSATPMMEKYLNEIDEFKNLPYYALDWVTEDPERLIRPDLKVRTMKSVGTKCEEIVNRYLDGRFESIKLKFPNGNIEEIESKEAVFYVNSVNHIINVINKCNLSPDQVNILCSDTDYNKKRLRARLKNRKFSIGKVPNPKKGETNKMFTFCTRTVYLGADFYSKCARSFIFSDANINTLVVDISEDLTQILGRQRDLDNPWKNSANFYYIPSNKSTKKEFNDNLRKKLNSSEILLGVYEKSNTIEKPELSKTYEKIAKTENYRDNYVAVNLNRKPVLNKLAILAEKRAYEIQKYDYADRFSIFNKLKNQFGKDSIDNDDELGDLKNKYEELTRNEKRLELLCSVSPDLMYRFINKYLSNSDQIKSILLILNQKRIIGLGYNITKINQVIHDQQALESMGDWIMSTFNEGDHFSCTFLSSQLQVVYDKLGIKVRAKATDINKWFKTKALLFTDKASGKRVRGIKLIKKL